MLASKVKSSFHIPAHNKIALQVHTAIGSESDEIKAIVTQNNITGVFTLFFADGDTWKKIATSKTPQFNELDKLDIELRSRN